MKINKLNYEAYAIDFLEGELTGETLQEMNRFLDKNPDIRQELEAMVFVPLKADTNIIFKNKNELIRQPEAIAPIIHRSSKNRLLFWSGLVAAILIGSLLTWKFLHNSPIDQHLPIVIDQHEPTLEQDPGQNKTIEHQEIIPEQINPVIAQDSPEVKSTPKLEPLNIKPDPAEPDSEKPVIDLPIAIEKSIPNTDLKTLEENPEKEIIAQENKIEELQKPVPTPQEVKTETPEALIAQAPVQETPSPEINIDLPKEEVNTIAQESPSPVENPIWEIEIPGEVVTAVNLPGIDDFSESNSNEISKPKKKKLFPKLRDKLSKENLGKSLLPEAFVSAKE